MSVEQAELSQTFYSANDYQNFVFKTTPLNENTKFKLEQQCEFVFAPPTPWWFGWTCPDSLNCNLYLYKPHKESRESVATGCSLQTGNIKVVNEVSDTNIRGHN